MMGSVSLSFVCTFHVVRGGWEGGERSEDGKGEGVSSRIKEVELEGGSGWELLAYIRARGGALCIDHGGSSSSKKQRQSWSVEKDGELEEGGRKTESSASFGARCFFLLSASRLTWAS